MSRAFEPSGYFLEILIFSEKVFTKVKFGGSNTILRDIFPPLSATPRVLTLSSSYLPAPYALQVIDYGYDPQDTSILAVLVIF